jgi:hypothetical protein
MVPGKKRVKDMWGKDREGVSHRVKPGMLVSGAETFCGVPDSALAAFYFTDNPPDPCPTCEKGDDDHGGEKEGAAQG